VLKNCLFVGWSCCEALEKLKKPNITPAAAPKKPKITQKKQHTHLPDDEELLANSLNRSTRAAAASAAGYTHVVKVTDAEDKAPKKSGRWTKKPRLDEGEQEELIDVKPADDDGSDKEEMETQKLPSRKRGRPRKEPKPEPESDSENDMEVDKEKGEEEEALQSKKKKKPEGKAMKGRANNRARKVHNYDNDDSDDSDDDSDDDDDDDDNHDDDERVLVKGKKYHQYSPTPKSSKADTAPARATRSAADKSPESLPVPVPKTSRAGNGGKRGRRAMCSECGEKGTDLVECDLCGCNTHLKCMLPPRVKEPRGPWHCNSCVS